MELVKKANDLIQAKYSLSLNEQRLILYLIGKITKNDDNFKEYTFTFSELAELTEIQKSRVYAEVEGIAYSLLRNPIAFTLENDKKLLCNWCSSFIFDLNNKECSISFDPKLKPFLLQLKECFTSYNLKYVTGFTSKYSFRIYEVLKQYENFKKRKMSIVELKAILELNTKYRLFNDLKRFVINPALKDINTHSDLNVSVKYSKTRRNITHLEFNIKSSLEHCHNQRQEEEILKEKKETVTREEKQKQAKKNEAFWKNQWGKLTEEEKKKWGGNGKGYMHFRAKKGILSGE